MTELRRSFDRSAHLRDHLALWWRRFVRHQNQFSVVSSVVAATLAVVLIVDLIVGHPHIQRGIVTVWILTYLVATALPLVFGRRYPRAAGIAFVTYLTAWGVYNLSNRVHPHMELNTFLEIPVTAVYLGWFYRASIARTVMGLQLTAGVVTVIVRPMSFEEDSFFSELVLLYAVLIAVFCLETGGYLRRRSESKARLDPLTGTLNRRGLGDLSAAAFARADRHAAPLTLVAIDFDDFKGINDSGGHAAGDAALTESAEEWLEGVGPKDLVARTGGDEFALLVHLEAADAADLMVRLHGQARHRWSWGLAQRQAGERLGALMRRADAELYLAKGSRGERKARSEAPHPDDAGHPPASPPPTSHGSAWDSDAPGLEC